MKKKNPNLYLLSAVSFINDISSEMIKPILPMFITSLGGSEAIVGLVGGLRDSLSSLLKLASGWLSDKKGQRKLFILGGYAVSSVFKLLLGFAAYWQHALLASVFERAGKGIRTAPRDAVLAESVDKAARGKSFGIHRAMDTAGAVVGSIGAFILFWYMGFNFKSIVLVAAGISFIAFIPALFVKEPETGISKAAEPEKIKITELNPKFISFIFASGIFALSRFSYMFFVLKSKDAFSGRLSTGIPILLYILFNIFYAALSVPFGKLSDYTGRKTILIAGYLLFSITCLGFGISDDLLIFILLFAMYGTVNAMIDGNSRAYVSDIVPEKLKGTALGGYHMVTGLAALPASLIAGLLWEHGAIYTFVFGAVLSLAAAMLFIARK